MASAPAFLRFLPLLAAFALAQPAAAQRVQTFAVPRDAATIEVAIRVARGDVVVDLVAGDAITVSTEPFDTAAAAVPLHVQLTGSTLTIADDDGATATRAVRLRVGIPRSVALTVRLGRGDVHVRGVQGTFDVSTRNGSVRLEAVAGAALVDLMNGSIDVAYRATDPMLPSVLTTLNGNVSVRGVPAERALEVRCRGCDVAALRADAGAEMLESVALPGNADQPVHVLRRGPVGAPAWLRVMAWNGEVSVAADSTPRP